jgi:hypothetical protein
MADLITSARAKYNLNNLATTSAEDTTLAALVTACSKAIKKYCRREFDSQTFDELYDHPVSGRLLLRQFPILSISRAAFEPTTVLRVKNTSASNQRATVAVTSTGLSLMRVASGVSSTDTSVTWAANATLTAVATAVNALGNGWSAAVADTAYNNRASADLRAVQGALHAKDVDAELKIHLQESRGYSIDAERGILAVGTGDWPLLDGATNYWRVIYTAGFATVPEDVQEACAQWVAALFFQTKRDPGLSQETLLASGARTPFSTIPPGAKALLAPYRKLSV